MTLAPLALAAALVGILGFAPSSFAQSSDRDARDYQSDRGSGRSGGDWRNDRFQLDDRDRDSRRGRSEDSDREDGQHGQYRGRHRAGEMGNFEAIARDHMQQRGARFQIESGDARIDIKCPAAEIDKCVQAAGQLFDRIHKRADSAPSASVSSGSDSPPQTPAGGPTPAR